MNELSYLCGLKNHAMNSEKFAEITARCQPHEVFSNEWTTYYPDDFADTLLPDAGIIKGKSLRFYDGAGIVPLTSSFPQHYMKLSTNDQIVSLIFFSYPKGVTAGEKVEGIRLGHDELWIHCSTYLSAITSTGQKASDAHVTALQNELKEMKSGTLPAKEEILPPDDYYLYWDCTDFISQRKEMGELVITMAVVTADGNSVTKTYSKITSKEFFQNVKENNYIIILDANDEEVQVFGASIIDRQTRFIKRIAEIYDTLSDKHKLILHLPEIMVKLGWLHGALCQIHWLEGSKATLKFPYEFFMSEERVENIDKIKLEEYFKGIRYISHTNTENLSYMPSNPDGDNFFLYNEKFEEVKKSLNLFLENLEKKADFIVIGGNEKLKQNISDKYPSTSPYTYCANNPVVLKDPNGRTWEELEDEKKADRLTQLAQKGIAWNQTKIEKYNNKLAKISNPNRQNQLKRKINEYETRNEYLEYGIYGLKLMAESTDFSFHFGDVKTGEVCYSEIRPDDELLSSGMITIYSDSYLATQWHECTHIWDWMTNYFGGEQYFYDCTRQLGHNENVDYDVETHALQSEFAFSKGRNHCGMNLFRYSDRFDDNTLYNSRSILDVSKKSYCNP